jgi:Spy/CpxP family protein refolding chaperone
VTRAWFQALTLACALVAIPFARADAQPARGPGEPPMMGGFGRPLFLEHLFRPELVMRHQGKLELTAEQREAITAAIKEAQERLGPLQWELDAKAEAVAKLVESDRVDVDATVASAEQVLDVESRIKKEHVRLLLRIKNVLTPEQQKKLRELRPDRCGPDRR